MKCDGICYEKSLFNMGAMILKQLGGCLGINEEELSGEPLRRIVLFQLSN